MAKIKKIIVAGPLVIEAVYPAPSPRDPEAVRQGKKHLSTRPSSGSTSKMPTASWSCCWPPILFMATSG